MLLPEAETLIKTMKGTIVQMNEQLKRLFSMIDNNSEQVDLLRQTIRQLESQVMLQQQEISNLKSKQSLLNTKVKLISQDNKNTLIGKTINKTYEEYKQGL